MTSPAQSYHNFRARLESLPYDTPLCMSPQV